jgi:hypothetical protein
MKQFKVAKSSEKKKRLSEPKPIQGCEYRFYPYEQPNNTHNRSESISGNQRQQRFHTDYGELQSGASQ